ncbi:Glycosyl transferases group 1 [Lachnospiraceae bacterium KH1T2]|nr:Glycosyl transferases group 1 [Lachnospiraceae bacterium KH1T2]
MNNNDLRILYFLDYPHNVGGSNKALLTQAYIMSQLGAKVKIIIPNDDLDKHDGEFDRICERYNLENEAIKFFVFACMEAIDIKKSFEFINDICRVVREFQPNIVHSTQLNIAVELVCRDCYIPHIMSIYPADKEEFNIKWDDIYPHYHCADSQYISDRWSQGLGIISRCIRVAYEGTFQVVNKKSDDLTIISIGYICELKNQLEIIKMVEKLHIEGIKLKLLLLGKDDTEYAKKCKQYVKNHGLDECIFFEGFVSNVEMYMLKSDALVHASLVESYPGVIVESMANNLPVISTPIVGITELLKDQYNGFLSRGYDSNSLYMSFMVFYKLWVKGKIKSITYNAYKTFKKYHSFNVVGRQLLDYYRWIINDYSKKENHPKSLQYSEGVERYFLDETENNCWFLSHIKRIIKGKKIIIWGAGYYGKVALEWFEKEFEIIGYIDKKKTGFFGDYKIMEFNEVCRYDAVIIVAVESRNARIEIMQKLEANNYIRNVTYFLMINSPLRI